MVESIYGEQQVQGILLKDGQDIKADVVLVSAGLSPEHTLATNAGLECNRAIVVNDNNQTYKKNVFAAGDCVHGPKTVIHAIDAGRNSAFAMLEYIKKLKEEKR